jgi:hypothetical protein
MAVDRIGLIGERLPVIAASVPELGDFGRTASAESVRTRYDGSLRTAICLQKPELNT